VIDKESNKERSKVQFKKSTQMLGSESQQAVADKFYRAKKPALQPELAY